VITTITPVTSDLHEYNHKYTNDHQQHQVISPATQTLTAASHTSNKNTINSINTTMASIILPKHKTIAISSNQSPLATHQSTHTN